MASIKAGDLDRRIEIQIATRNKDKAGDEVDDWRLAFKLWSKQREYRGIEMNGAQQTVRTADCVFTVRTGTQPRTIAPESHRVVHHGRIFEIIGVQESADLNDGLDILACSRPDLVGARGLIQESGES